MRKWKQCLKLTMQNYVFALNRDFNKKHSMKEVKGVNANHIQYLQFN